MGRDSVGTMDSDSGRRPIVWEEMDVREDAEEQLRRMLRPHLGPWMSTSEWKYFRNFFNPERYEATDNSHNLACEQLLRLWSLWYGRQDHNHGLHNSERMPRIRAFRTRASRREIVSAVDLDGETCNLQGLNWNEMGTTSADVREARRRTYIHKTKRMDNIYGTPPQIDDDGQSRVRQYMHKMGMSWAKDIPRYDNHFRFRRMFLQYRPHLAHFQLRNMVFASSINAVFYAGEENVYLLNPQTESRSTVMTLGKWCRPGPSHGTITTLTASDGVLIVGGWMGQYAMKSLMSDYEATWVEGLPSGTLDASINHIHTFVNRHNGAVRAAIASNDRMIQILDCATNMIVQTHKLPNAVNCSVTSPDGRLRLLVGDQTEPWILDADSGELLVRLPNHRDHGFACDWAQDGVHAATGNQDGIVQIWDSRQWSKPLQILSTELSGVRAMKFSPVGSGKRVLAMAEPADVVSIVNAETFKSKQQFDFLGEIGGLSFTPDGQRLYVGNTDRLHGGILEFERAGDGEKYGMARPDPSWEHEWAIDADRMDDDVMLQSSRKRKRRAIRLDEIAI